MTAQCEVTAKHAAGAWLGIFARYLTVWVFLCIFAGIALDQILPAVFHAVGRMEVAHVNLPVNTAHNVYYVKSRIPSRADKAGCESIWTSAALSGMAGASPPWGRARNWRLIGPVGTDYAAPLIADIPRMLLDLDYLQVRVAALQAQQDAAAVHLSPDDAATLRAAAALIERLASPYSVKRRRPGTELPRLVLAEPHPKLQRRMK